MQRRTKAFGIFLSTLLLALTGSAAAQQPAARPPAQPPSAAPPAPEKPALTAAQLSSFSRLVGAPESEVGPRLAADAGLRGTALHALEAREARRSSARARAVAGFVILGVGDIAGAIIIVTTPGYPTVEKKDNGRLVAGLVLSVASLGAGLALAIPALAGMGRQGPEERQAVTDYRQQAQPPPPVERPPAAARGATMPVLSFSF